ncbi:WD domain-containing protein [Thraustotheca clavata]|uniref:WD domain-containing protein n=1 Tax=Thraustotheca clavata TaxID=74557 RepID=A0A1V9ZVW4_9STRA|nr:WD domain-containing protein [Thraustotheca clavata]
MATSASAMLVHRYMYGLKGTVRNNIAFSDENIVVYPCGHNLVVHSIETKEQQFIHGMEGGTGGITAMAVSSSRKYIAIAEKSEYGLIHVYDLTTFRRKKPLSYPDLGSDSYVSLAFSSDGKYIVAQGGHPEWNLVLWSWEKIKVVAAIRSVAQYGCTIVQVDFSPNDTNTICGCGASTIKFFKVIDGQLRQQVSSLKREPGNFLCHTWLPDDRVVAATLTGELWLFENLEFRAILSSSPTEGQYISSLLAYSKGFVGGGSGGIIRIYEKSDDAREHFKRTKTFTIDGNSHCIQNLAISPSEDTLVCSLESNQLFMLTLSSTDILKEDAMNFELVSTPFHRPGSNNSSQITGLDVCIRKPLIVTCGVDKSVRVWNYNDKSTDILKFFKEEALAIALHPSGLHVVVAFVDKLRMLNILMDDIRPYREFPVKSCREVRFSHGGQYLAVANNNTIQIYGTYSGELMSVLRGHTNQVNSIVWKQGDRKLVSCGSDGSIFQWDLRNAVKIGDGHTHPRCNYTDFALSSDSNLLYASGTDGTLKEIDLASGTSRIEHVSNCLYGPLVMTTSQSLLFVGTIDPLRPGNIRAYKLPLEAESTFTEYQCHDLPVTRLRLSHDNQYLFSVGEDGSLCIFETKEMALSSKLKGRSDRENAMQFAEEILLKTKVDELTLHNEYQLRLKDMNYKEKIQEVSDKFTSELTQDRQRCNDLQEDKREMEGEYDSKFQELETNHQKEIDEMRRTYEAKIKAEVERYEALTQDRDEENARWEEENQLMVESHTQFLAEMTTEYDQKVDSEQAKQSQLGGEKEEIMNEFEESKKQIEDDADLEIEEVKTKYDAKFLEEREATLRLKGENGIMKKKFTALQKDIEDQKEEIRSLQEKGRELYENIKGLEKDIQGHKKEIREREETIQDKEKRIYDLKKKNQELEKFKFVLDYKIKELKRQIEPREHEIADMKLQIEEMDQELEHYHKSNAALDLMIGELTLNRINFV